MKKKIVIILGILIYLLVLAIPVKAAELSAITSSSKGHVGEEVTITVTLSQKVNVLSGAVSFEYDKNALDIVSGTFNLTGATLANWDNSKELGAFMFMGGADISGIIFTAKVKILDTASLGSESIKAIVQLDDTSNKDISVTNVSGTISIECKHDFTNQNTDSSYLAAQASCVKGITYYYSCTKCGEKGTKTFSVGEGLGHKFDKKSESSKYLAKSGSCTEPSTYYYSCSVCGEKGKDTFKGTIIPGHKYEKNYKSDANNHWHECECGDKKSVEAHIPGPIATETKPQVCTVCGYIIQPALGHTHKYGSTYKTDNNNHWYECTCGEKNQMEKHTFEWIIDKEATEDETGIKHEECKDCGYKRNEETIIEKVDHVHLPTKLPATLSTHLKQGNNEYYQCSSCGKYYKDENCTIETTVEAEKLPTTPDHEYGDWIEVKKATYEEEGLEERTCICGHKEYMKVSPLIKPIEAKSNTIWIIVSIVEGVIVLSLGVALTLVLLKKKKGVSTL